MSETGNTVHRFRVRAWLQKKDRYRFVSHLGMVVALRRALIRSKLPIMFTRGYHPLPRLSFGPALRTGYLSRGEPVDINLYEDIGVQEISRRLNRQLPPHMSVIRLDRLGENDAGCGSAFTSSRMMVVFSQDDPAADCDAVSRCDKLTGGVAVIHGGGKIVDGPRPASLETVREMCGFDWKEPGTAAARCWYQATFLLPISSSSNFEDIVGSLAGGAGTVTWFAARESFE